MPIHEKFLPELLDRHRGQRLTLLRRSEGGGSRELGDFCGRRNAADRTAAMRICPMWSRWRARFPGRSTITRSWSRRARCRFTPASGCERSFCAMALIRRLVRRGLQSRVSARRHGGDRFSVSGPHRGGRRSAPARAEVLAGNLCASDGRHVTTSARMRFRDRTARRFLRR